MIGIVRWPADPARPFVLHVALGPYALRVPFPTAQAAARMAPAYARGLIDACTARELRASPR